MIPFPPALAPPAPFPLVLSQSMTAAFVAPGIRRAEYRLVTNLGPMAIHVIAIDPSEPTVRIDVVTARDRLVSNGETVSAMAARTGAVAGVNADYFDIGQTNQPLNVVVRSGILERSPSKRAAMLVGPRNAVTFGGIGFSGTATWPGASVPVTTYNEFPPQGGAGFVTPAFGTIVGNAPVTAAALAPEPGTTPGRPGTYRVTAVGPAAKGPVTEPILALGPAALTLAAPPNVGDDVAIAYATVPALATIRAAVGGGPLLLADGAAYDDPNAPAPEERNVRFPVSGAGTAADGTVLFAAVDGRQTALSIGVTRPEFGALFAGLGATNALAFDSGGSATLVGRVLGDARASVLNVPSDGVERPVADGVFAYSTAPNGPPAMLVTRPATFAALPGASVAVTIGAVDAAGRPIAGTRVQTIVAAGAPGPRTLRVADHGLTAAYTYRVVASAAHLRIAPSVPNPDPGASITLTALATAADGTPIAGVAPLWRAERGTVRPASGDAVYTAGSRDALVTASVPGASAGVVVRVGRHLAPLALAVPDAKPWRFASAPANLPGSATVVPGTPPALALGYDFSGGERAAYAQTTTVLPGTPLGFGVAVDDGGRTLLIRGLFMNNLGERRAFTLTANAHAALLASHAEAFGAAGRILGVDFPSDLYPPVTLLSLYVLPQATTQRSAGTATFRAPFVVAPGTP